MPQYLDNNVWSGAGGFTQQAGGDFSNAIVGLARLKYAQQLQSQEAMRQAMQMQLQQRQQGLAEQEFEAKRPLLGAQTQSFQAGAELDRSKVAQAQQQQQLGQLVNAALRARQAVAMPGQEAQQVPIPPELAQALGPQRQFTQEAMLQALSGIIGGAGGQVALQAPAAAVPGLAQAMYMQTPEGLKDVAAGYPPNPARQYMTPEQEATLRLGIPLVQGAMRPETDITGARPAPDVQAGADVAAQIRGAMFGGGTNAPAAIQTPQPMRQALPKVGEVRKGYRYKGGDPSKQSSWEKVQ